MATLTQPATVDSDDVSRSPSSQANEKVVDDVVDEPVQHIHAKTIILLIASTSFPEQGGLLTTHRLLLESTSFKSSI